MIVYGDVFKDINPSCPTLLLFAKEDSFGVQSVAYKLQGKEHLSILEFNAEHGFLDPYSKHYNHKKSKRAEEAINCFFNECIK